MLKFQLHTGIQPTKKNSIMGRTIKLILFSTSLLFFSLKLNHTLEISFFIASAQAQEGCEGTSDSAGTTTTCTPQGESGGDDSRGGSAHGGGNANVGSGGNNNNGSGGDRSGGSSDSDSQNDRSDEQEDIRPNRAQCRAEADVEYYKCKSPPLNWRNRTIRTCLTWERNGGFAARGGQ